VQRLQRRRSFGKEGACGEDSEALVGAVQAARRRQRVGYPSAGQGIDAERDHQQRRAVPRGARRARRTHYLDEASFSEPKIDLGGMNSARVTPKLAGSDRDSYNYQADYATYGKATQTDYDRDVANRKS